MYELYLWILRLLNDFKKGLAFLRLCPILCLLLSLYDMRVKSVVLLISGNSWPEFIAYVATLDSYICLVF